MQSQEAFELASKGLLRPKSVQTPPQIYSLRCVEFHKPFFKIGNKLEFYWLKNHHFYVLILPEVYTINESTRFLRQLVHDIGMRLKAYAICHQIRRVKDGFIGFDSNDCLAYNELEYDRLVESTTNVTEQARVYIKKYDKTILVGHSREEEKDIINKI